MKTLVVGGAGYIGSHMVRLLADQGHEVRVLDDLSTGHRGALAPDQLIEGSLLDPAALDQAFEQARPEVVLHFAAKSIIPESVREPQLYYQTNLSGTMQLLEAMRRHQCERLIFSSTAAVYGTPEVVPITESAATRPISPYGRTKLFMEQMIADYAAAYDLRTISLRYFNAAGAHASGQIGEAHEPETHLIPNILRSIAEGNFTLQLFGTDHPTADGTCVRDYIHVTDLVSAHLRAAERLSELAGGTSEVFNLGVGHGYSVLEVLEAAQQVVGREIPRELRPARAGDPPALIADPSLANRLLGWACEHSDLDTILRSAWRWHQGAGFTST